MALAVAMLVAAVAPGATPAGPGGVVRSAEADPTTKPPAKPAVTPASLEQRFTTEAKPFMVNHCFHCHGNGKTKGDLSLDKYLTWQDVQKDKQIWTHIIEVLQQGLMPPEERKQPTKEEKDKVIAFASDAMEYLDCSGPRDPGFVAIHRLNKNEYNNTIRDLVAVDFKPADDFPA